MKFYDIDSVFTFGKYEGMTIAEVYEKDPKYIKYCEENIDEFYVSPSVKRELKSLGRAASDSALLNMNFDKMSDDEIEAFMHHADEDDEFSEERLEEGRIPGLRYHEGRGFRLGQRRHPRRQSLRRV